MPVPTNQGWTSFIQIPEHAERVQQIEEVNRALRSIWNHLEALNRTTTNQAGDLTNQAASIATIIRTATTVIPAPAVPSGGGPAPVVIQPFYEIPLGIVNGVNTLFTVSQAPANSVAVVLQNGVAISPLSFTVTGATIQFVAAPFTGDTVFAWYIASAVAQPYFEIASGIANGSNTLFTLSHTPTSPAVVVFQNGLAISPLSFSVVGATIQFVTAPFTGDTVYAWYT